MVYTNLEFESGGENLLVHPDNGTEVRPVSQSGLVKRLADFTRKHRFLNSTRLCELIMTKSIGNSYSR